MFDPHAVGYSLLREFADFLNNLANYKDFNSKNNWAEPDEFVRDITTRAYKGLTPSLRSDLKLLVKDTVLFTYPFYSSSAIDRFHDYLTYRKFLDSLDGEGYIKFFLECNGDEIPGNTPDEQMEELEIILKNVDQKEHVLESYREFKRYPREQMARFLSFFDRMHREFFLPHEERIESSLKEKSRSHTALYQNDPLSFKKELILIDLKDRDRGELTYEFMVCYMTIGMLSYSLQGNKVRVFYSHSLEKLLDPAHLDDRMMDLFKALSDESRLAMVRAMAEKPRYGSELARDLNLTRGTLSHHMKILNRFNIFRVKLGESKRIYYSLDKEKLERLFSRFLDSLD